MAVTPASFPAIPILMERVTDEVPPPAPDAPPLPLPSPPARSATAGEVAVASPRPLPGREAQQALFDEADLPPAPAQPVRRRKPAPSLQRLAEDLLRARAPAIINELADEHARRLSAELGERLHRELVRLLAELAARDNEGPASEETPRLPAPAEDGGTSSL